MKASDLSNQNIRSFWSEASLWNPDWIGPSSWLEHAPFAFWITQAIRPKKLVELGTHHGFSYLAFCQAVQRLELGTACYAVDTWRGDEHSGFYSEEIFLSLSAYHDRRYSNFSRLLRMKFDEAVAYFEDKSVDLLHIDGRHFYEDVREDFSLSGARSYLSALSCYFTTSMSASGNSVFGDSGKN